jgi:aerobic-type carbon monoxide dehydrogenase small subunit (CoxS/CutS family)
MMVDNLTSQDENHSSTGSCTIMVDKQRINHNSNHSLLSLTLNIDGRHSSH